MRCHTYDTCARISRAMSLAILFSKPCSCLFEKGRLSGSAHTRSSLPLTLLAHSSSADSATTLRKGEYIQRPPLRRIFRQILHRGHESERRRFVARIQYAGHDRSGPPANTREPRHIRLAVGPFVSDWLADNSRAGLELP